MMKTIDGLVNLDVSELIINDTLCLPNGTAAAPSLKFSSDQDTGMYLQGANNICFATGGVDRFNLSDTSILAARDFNIVDSSTGDVDLIIQNNVFPQPKMAQSQEE